MLTSLLLIPILGVLALSFVSDNSESRIKQIALFATLLNFIVSLVLWGEFDSNSSQYQFTTEFNQVNFCHLHIGVDGLSLYYVLLTTFTMPICLLASWENVKVFADVAFSGELVDSTTDYQAELDKAAMTSSHNKLKYFIMAFLMLESLLIALFVVLDLLLFYVFFESVLIPLFLVVGIWGATETRIRASFLLFLYTLFGSLFMLLAFLVIIYNVGTSDLQVISMADISFDSQKYLWLAIFLSFAIKTPLVPFHLWLIKAHVEAPVAGSMVLAGLVLKLATYGIIRILIPILPEATAYFTPLAYTFGIVSIIYASLSALRQTDFKCLVAYSSIAHMGVVILGLFSNTIQGIEGAIVLSIGHGFVSPALFFIVGSVLYDRYHTRVIRYYRGLVLYMPVAMLLFFLFTLANMGTPGISVNWVGELLALTGAYQLNPVATLVGATSIVLSAGYSIWLFNRLAFGAYSPYLSVLVGAIADVVEGTSTVTSAKPTKSSSDLSRREYLILFSLLIPTIVFALFPNLLLDNLHYSVSTLIYT